MIYELVMAGSAFAALELRLRLGGVKIIKVNTLPAKGAAAMSLPGYVLMKEYVWNDEDVLAHELMHIEQMKRYTIAGVCVLMGLHYGVGMVQEFLTNPKGFSMRESFWTLWHTNPLEREANSVMYRGEY